MVNFPFLTPGKVVIILRGRFAGKKAIIVKTFEGTMERKFGHALVAGIERAPEKVTKAMDKKKIEKRSKCKPFVKFVNLRHIMPTRYHVDIDVKSVIKAADMAPDAKPTARKEAKKSLKELFAKRYLSKHGNNPGIKFFYTKLRF
uniref:KOW domain-containing protein n=1 Tax=Lotharella oceanica TaxID=641309 RepID=A0A7S2U0Y4_9EUKA|mmetsp:Transcript_36764/g.67876  ORF Transcript_36764/g.67876 Transcript_36764/m.67876 type:complete len:145 (+) Transcript_36764:27-461(+)